MPARSAAPGVRCERPLPSCQHSLAALSTAVRPNPRHISRRGMRMAGRISKASGRTRTALPWSARQATRSCSFPRPRRGRSTRSALRREEDPGPSDPPEWNDERRIERVSGTLRSSIIIDPPDGQLPGNEDASQAHRQPSARGFALPWKGPSSGRLPERCIGTRSIAATDALDPGRATCIRSFRLRTRSWCSRSRCTMRASFA